MKVIFNNALHRYEAANSGTSTDILLPNAVSEQVISDVEMKNSIMKI